MCCYKIVARSFSRFSKIAAYVVPFLVMVSLCMWPCSGQAEPGSPGAIKGQITGPDGQPVGNLQVLAIENISDKFFISSFSCSRWRSSVMSVTIPSIDNPP